jgi:two-component system sensor histidine kinase VicK
MTHIVQDLLTLSRFDSEQNKLALSTFPFGEVLRDSYQAVLLEAQRHGHRLSLTGDQGLPEIRGDRERILQVIMNILSNAIKYTPDGGRIAMTAGKAGDMVWLEVADNGIGIPEEDRDRIFERFYRVDKARSRESGGTGLGLSIAQEIIQRHEGKLLLVDKITPGTTIRMELRIGGPQV